MGFFDKVKRAFKGAAGAGKKTAGEAADFTAAVGRNVAKEGEMAAEFTGEVATKARDGLDTAADKAGDTLTPQSAPRRL